MNKVKTYCYKSNCGPIVRTGFQHDFYNVCSSCKEEVCDRIKDAYEEKQKKKDETDKDSNTIDDDDFIQFWAMNNNYTDPMGD